MDDMKVAQQEPIIMQVLLELQLPTQLWLPAELALLQVALLGQLHYLRLPLHQIWRLMVDILQQLVERWSEQQMLLITQRRHQLYMHIIFQLVLQHQPDMEFTLKPKTAEKKFRVLHVLKQHQLLEKHT